MRQMLDVLHKPAGSRRAGEPRMNTPDLVIITVAGKVAHPTSRRAPYRIGQDGIPRVLPGTGGVVINRRVGDRCIGLAADHLEPGVSVRNDQRPVKGDKDGPNLALNTYACVGNTALVLDGPCRGSKGVVTGKHGGVNHVLVDFPTTVLKKLRIGDNVQIYAHGIGLRLPDYPGLSVYNCSPGLIQHWGLQASRSHLQVPVTHLLPAAIMGSGLGRDNAARGDYDIQLFDPVVRRQLRLDTLRFGDLVAILHADTRFGRAYHKGFMTIGIVVHGDSTVSGHGPGVVTLLTGEARYLQPIRDNNANLAAILKLRAPRPAAPHTPLIAKEQRQTLRPAARRKRPSLFRVE